MPDTDPRSFLPLPNLPLHVLLVLAEGEMHGWAIIKRIEELTEGGRSPSSGSLYLAMARLEGQGLIADAPSPPEATDERRRHYRLTPNGRRVLALEMDRLSGLVERARSLGLTG